MVVSRAAYHHVPRCRDVWLFSIVKPLPDFTVPDALVLRCIAGGSVLVHENSKIFLHLSQRINFCLFGFGLIENV